MDTNKNHSSPSAEDIIHQYEHPYVTVNILLFTIDKNELKILLVNRGVEPFKGSWAIPGSFIYANETLEQATARQLFEVTGLKNFYTEQLYTFGEPKRDPRARAISVAYMGLVNNSDIGLKTSERFTNTKWFTIHDVPKLAFDHNKIMSYALNRLKSKIEYSNIVHNLLPKEFSLGALQQVYEIILGLKLDKRNFRKKMLSTGLLVKTGKTFTDHAHRPPMLYNFTSKETVFLD